MKQTYEAPVVQVLEMELQGMLAQSPGTDSSRGGFDAGGEWTTGG